MRSLQAEIAGATADKLDKDTLSPKLAADAAPRVTVIAERSHVEGPRATSIDVDGYSDAKEVPVRRPIYEWKYKPPGGVPVSKVRSKKQKEVLPKGYLRCPYCGVVQKLRVLAVCVNCGGPLLDENKERKET